MTQEMNRDALTRGRGSAESVESTEPTGTLATAPARLSRRGALGLLSATAAGVLAGCTALPSSSRVTRSGVAASDTNALIETAPGPGEGDSAEDIVNGFLRAAIAGFSDDFATAKQFLSDHAVAQWKPLETVSAYSGSTEPQVSVTANGSFMVTSGQVGVLNSLGVFTPAPEGSTYAGVFSLATNSTGQWRIVGLPHGILLPLSRLMQNFAVSSLAFLSRDRSRFVPELRWYPRSSQADSLVSGLLAGPSDWLAKGASSLIPRNAERAGRGGRRRGRHRHCPPERGLRPRLGGRPRAHGGPDRAESRPDQRYRPRAGARRHRRPRCRRPADTDGPRGRRHRGDVGGFGRARYGGQAHHPGQ
nr:hypothetical protein [Actinomyces sp. oral taxon 169]